MKNKSIILHLCVLFILCFLIHCSHQANPSQNMNILLITADTLRADHLGCYGYHRSTSPNIDALASKSIQFMDTSSTINITNPSHISILTAQYPKNHDVYTNWKPISKDHITLPEILKNYGYKTSAFVSARHMDKEIIGLGKKFDYYQNSKEFKDPADETIHDALGWINKNAGKSEP